MTTSHFPLFLAAALIGTLAQTQASASPQTVNLRVDQDQVRLANDFVKALRSYHEKQLKAHDVNVTKRTARYNGEAAKAYVYRDEHFVDRKTDRLLSRIRRDDAQPERLHMIEVNVYENGKLVRDYSAIFLPWSQHAPNRTFANLHAYNDGLHAFRQFDATGDLIYEQCRGTFNGQLVWVDRIEPPYNSEKPPAEIYNACFAGLPYKAGELLTPK